MESPTYFRERRKYPRSMMDLPLEYRMKDLPQAHGGLVVNASEEGLLIHSIKDMPVGLKLNIIVLFPKDFELTNFEVSAEIIWKDFHVYGNSEGFKYGLKIIQVVDEEQSKLKQLLNDLFQWSEISYNF